MARTLHRLLLLSILLLPLAGCQELGFDELDKDHDLTVENRCDVDLLIHVDEIRVMELTAGEDGLIEGLEEGYRQFAAYLDDGGYEGELVAWFWILVSGYEDYVWLIDQCDIPDPDESTGSGR